MTVDQVFKSLGDFIKTLVLCPIVKGQKNFVPPPNGPFIVMTQVGQNRLGTNEDSYDTLTQNKTITRYTQYDIQLDFYGDGSGDRAGIVETAFRDEYGTENFGNLIQPLYCTDAKQMPLINGEQNYEQRWTIVASMQANLDVIVAQQSATQLSVTPVNVNVTYP